MVENKWIFDTKIVRAIKCEKYGDEYSACCQLNISCGIMYIDSMIANNKQLSKSDFREIVEYAKSMNINKIYYHRYKKGKRILRTVKL